MGGIGKEGTEKVVLRESSGEWGVAVATHRTNQWLWYSYGFTVYGSVMKEEVGFINSAFTRRSTPVK